MRSINELRRLCQVVDDNDFSSSSNTETRPTDLSTRSNVAEKVDDLGWNRNFITGVEVIGGQRTAEKAFRKEEISPYMLHATLPLVLFPWVAARDCWGLRRLSRWFPGAGKVVKGPYIW